MLSATSGSVSEYTVSRSSFSTRTVPGAPAKNRKALPSIVNGSVR